MLAASRNSWAVQDNWITFHGSALGDFVDDVIDQTNSGDMKVRLSAMIALGNRASADSSDKRALPVMLTRLGDSEAAIRMVAAAALAIPGWVDATVDPCLRNRLIAQLQANESVDPSVATKTQAAKTVKFLLQLGMFDPTRVPMAEKCGAGAPPFVPTTVSTGPLVDPSKPPTFVKVGLSAGETAAIAGAAALTIGVLVYAIVGRRDPAPIRKRVKRR